jgi:4-hydroxy-tetrahydrodipicolinate synthase
VALSGEMYELSPAERTVVARRVVDRAGRRVPVAAAAVGAGTTASVVDEARALADAGVDLVVLIASALAGADESEEVVIDRVRAVLGACPAVVFGIYECPLPYHRLLSEDAVATLAATGRFAFFKETTHDLDRMQKRVADAGGTPLRVYNAGIENYAQSVAIGVAGLSGWIVNVAPDLVARLGELASSEGLTPRVRALQDALVEVESRMGPTYPASAKALVERRAGLGWSPRSRWRASDVDGSLVDDLVERLVQAEAVAAP